MSNYGYQNERDFVCLFNNKFLHQLDNNSKCFLKELFGDILDDDEVLISWKNKIPQKTDIFIKYKNHIKNISLKCGSNNSVHSESIQDFKMYLEKIDIPYKVIDKYVSYHYGYYRDINGNIDLSKPLSADEYKKLFQNEIDEFNSYINQTRIIVDMVDRFIIRGRNSDYDVDALICGTVNDYVWIMKYDLYDLILSDRRLEYTSPHIACMTIGPRKRNLNGEIKNKRDRYVICVRWSYIRESIIKYKNSKVNSDKACSNSIFKVIPAFIHSTKKRT